MKRRRLVAAAGSKESAEPVAILICFRPIFVPGADITDLVISEVLPRLGEIPSIIVIHIGDCDWAAPFDPARLKDMITTPTLFVVERSSMFRGVYLHTPLRETQLSPTDDIMERVPLGFSILDPEITEDGSFFCDSDFRRRGDNPSRIPTGVTAAARFCRRIGTFVR